MYTVLRSGLTYSVRSHQPRPDLVDSFKNNEQELKHELEKIKDQFFELLNTLGLSHDIYYNAVTPADTPESLHLRLQQSIRAAAATLAQHQENSQNISRVHRNGHPTKYHRMSTQRSTPRRRKHGRQHGIDMSSKYADLVLEQLLAKAQTESNSSSSKSNSPPDPPSLAHHAAAAVSYVPDQWHSHRQDNHNTTFLPDSVNINRGSDDAGKNSAKFKDIPVSSGLETSIGGDMMMHDVDRTLLEHPELVDTEEQELLVPTVTPEVLLSTTSSSAPVFSSESSSNSSVPDLNKELVSRMQYYSDFTIDRQKKIDEAERILGPVTEVSDSSSPPSTVPEESAGERISPRCVEGSESVDRFKLPLPPKKLLVQSFLGTKGSVTDESDTSSGTGSMPSSQKTSHPSSHHCSYSSKHSSRDRPSSRSSGDHRSSSRSSRCSTHPLASSTFISDPNSGSADSGSVYTWSLDNSSDENLHHSFLRSEKRRNKCSRRRRLKSSHPSAVMDSVARPETVIGADSPPHDKLFDTRSTLHLTHEFSVIDSTPRRFGGNRFENGIHSTALRSSSLPRTSTRIGVGFMMKGENDMHQKASSSPELSNPCSDLNCALSRIGPSNPISFQQSSKIRSSSITFKERLEVPGKSSTSESTTSYHSQCLTCNPGLAGRLASGRLIGNENPCDEILTNSPNSYSSSGVQPPFNSYVSPNDSSNEYTTVSSLSEHSILASAPRQPRAFAVKSPSMFKIPFGPASRTVKRKAGAAGHSAHSVGVGTVGTPHFPVSSLKHKEPISRRKLFASGQSHLAGPHHAPKILDRKALVRKFMKFSNNFKKDKDSAKIHTLANL